MTSKLQPNGGIAVLLGSLHMSSPSTHTRTSRPLELEGEPVPAWARSALRGSIRLLLLYGSLGACTPDFDSLRGPELNTGNSGAGGSGGGAGCDGGSCVEPAGGGGNGGSPSGGGAAGDRPSGGSGGSSPQAPQLRYDFENENLGLQGWIPLNPQRPIGVQDSLERTSEAAHDGSHSLRMVFDGSYPDAGLPPADPFYGIQRSGGPPSGVEVTFWMMTTSDGVSVEPFAQTGTTFTWNVLSYITLLPNQWQEISVFLPPSSAGALSNWGVKVYSPFDIEGYIYLDEVTW